MPESKQRSNKIFKKVKTLLVRSLRHLKVSHYIVLALILGLGIFNGVTGLMPHIKQFQREQNIVKTFNQWWKDAGADQFKSVGLEPTQKIRDEEFQRYRERYLSQNQSYVIEERLQIMSQDYLEWWEVKGGKEAFLQAHNRMPDDKDYNRSLNEWLNKYTDQFVRYNMAYSPKWQHYERLATSWMLFPSVFSFLIFGFFFFFGFSMLRVRWKKMMIVGSTVALAVGGGALIDLLASTSFFNHYAQDRYMGMSLALAFILGATAFGPQKDTVSMRTRGIAIAGLFLDMIVNWFVNPGLFGAVAMLSPLLFGAGALAGIKVETRRKTQSEIAVENFRERMNQKTPANPMAERRAKTRGMIEEGFKAAKEGLNERAQQILSYVFTSLLQEHPVDTPLVKSLAERMTSPSLYIEVPSMQWLEWGEIAKSKNAPEAAILLLKKGLGIEKDATLARRALYILGEICVNNGIEQEDGIRRLQKVIEMNPNDILAMQAKRMLSLKEPGLDS